jgi:hypothetical protein
MKKINLKGLMETLSEKELKGIMAGSGAGSEPCGGNAYCDLSAVCYVNGNIGKCRINIMSYCVCFLN